MKYFLLIILATSVFPLWGQTKYGANADTINAASLLELESDAAGILLPRLTDTERDSQSDWEEGHIIYNTTAQCFQFFDGTEWICMHTQSDSGSSGTGGQAAGLVFGDSNGTQYLSPNHNHFISTSDGGSLLVGSEEGKGMVNMPPSLLGGINTFVIKFDANMEIEWSRMIGTNGHDLAGSVIEHPSGDFIVVGATTGNDGDFADSLATSFTQDFSSHGSMHAFFARLSPTGDIVNTKIVTSNANAFYIDQGNASIPIRAFYGQLLANGELLLYKGYYSSSTSVGIGAATVDLSNGNITNQTNLVSGNNGIAYRRSVSEQAVALPTGGFVISYSNELAVGGPKYVVEKYSDALTLEWSINLGIGPVASFSKCVLLLDTTNSYIYAITVSSIRRLDFNGNVLATSSTGISSGRHVSNISDALINEDGDIAIIGSIVPSGTSSSGSFYAKSAGLHNTLGFNESIGLYQCAYLIYHRINGTTLAAEGQAQLHAPPYGNAISTANLIEAADGSIFTSINIFDMLPNPFSETGTRNNIAILQLSKTGDIGN